MDTILNYIAIFFSIIGISVVSIYRWAKSHVFIMKVHDPSKALRDSDLSFEDARRGLAFLAEDAKAFQPDFIYGINRGGAIVGGYISKQINITKVYLLSVNCDRPIGKRVLEHRQDNQQVKGKILLVDDAKRKGEHMREAYDYLVSHYPQTQIRRVVLLEMRIPHLGPEKKAFQGPTAERAAFFTHQGNIRLPWDP